MPKEHTDPLPLKAGQIELLYDRARTEAAGLLVSAFVLAILCWKSVDSAHVIIWACAVAIIGGARLVIAQVYRRTATEALAGSRWFTLFIAGSAILGTAFGGISLSVAVAADLTATVPVVLWLACVAFGAVAIYAGLMMPVLAFALPALVPVGVYLLTHLSPGAFAVGSMALAAMAVVVFAARQTQVITNKLLTLEHDTAQLRSHLDVRRDQIEKLTVGMKTNAEKRQKAEIELRRTAADLGLMKGKAQALSETLSRVSPQCPVTGIANRRTFDEHIDHEWRRAMREKRPLSLIICEVDQFDLYNDTYGTQSGDALLKRIAKLACAVGRRAGDLTARFDGPRFALILPGCDTRNAARLAEALRKRIEGQKIPRASTKVDDFVTAHLGVATMIPTRAHKPKDLLDRIETAMYEAKFQGGNKVVIYRALAKLRLERWDLKSDGALTLETLVQKMLIWGYEGPRTVYPPGAVVPDKSYETETICAVLAGELRLIIEGQALVLKPGDCLFVPPGTTYSAEVLGKNPLICFEAAKAT